jgi:hypothetical protein
MIFILFGTALGAAVGYLCGMLDKKRKTLSLHLDLLRAE